MGFDVILGVYDFTGYRLLYNKQIGGIEVEY